MRVLRDRIEAAKIKLSVLTRVELQLPVTVAAGDATRDRNGSGDGDGSGGGDAMGGDAARGGGAAGLGDSPAPGGGGDGDEGDAVIVLTRSAVEGACEALLQRLKAPLYEVALAAKVALPGEEKAAAPRRKPKLKARLAAETQLPKGKKVYLPQGEPIAEIVMVGGAAQMAAVSGWPRESWEGTEHQPRPAHMLMIDGALAGGEAARRPVSVAIYAQGLAALAAMTPLRFSALPLGALLGAAAPPLCPTPPAPTTAARATPLPPRPPSGAHAGDQPLRCRAPPYGAPYGGGRPRRRRLRRHAPRRAPRPGDAVLAGQAG